MSIGIYKIINPKGKIYIGKSKNIENRWNDYIKIQRCSQQRKLYYSLKKYGSENHIFEIIEKCLIEECNNKEKYWIKFYNSVEIGLNLTEGGDGGTISKESQELRRINHMKAIIQYDLQGNFIKEYKGASEAILNIGKGNSNNINDCARGIYKSTYGYQWKYKTKNYPLKIEPFKNNQGNKNKWTEERRIKTKISRIGEKRSKEYAEKIRKLKLKPIYQFDESNKLINIFESFNLFDNSGLIGTTKLRKILNKPIYYKGYRFSHEK